MAKLSEQAVRDCLEKWQEKLKHAASDVQRRYIEMQIAYYRRMLAWR